MKTKIENAWREFWTAPASPRPLGVLRIGTGAVLLLQAWAIAPQFWQLYGADGILQGTLRELLGDSPLGLLTQALQAIGIGEPSTLAGVAIAYLAALVALTLGYHTRRAAVATWLTHWLLASGHITSYGLDTFAAVTLFYLVWIPCGNAFSLDVAAGRADRAPSAEARWGLRVLQLHLSIAYLACGLDKAMGAQWWNGDAIWRSVVLPMYAQMDLRWLSRAPWLATLSGWGTLVVECGYPLGMWIRPLRKLWLVAIIGLHLGICFLMGLPLFALMMIVLSFSAFGVSAEALPVAVPARASEEGLAYDSAAEDRVLRRGVWGL